MAGSSTKFEWPPARIRVDSVGDALSASRHPASIDPEVRPAPSRTVRHLIEIEKFWLDPVMISLRSEIDATGWEPDQPDRYCDRCGCDVGSGEASEFGCATCRGSRLPWDFMVRLSAYRGPVVEWIHDLKFHRRRDVALVCGKLIGRAFGAAMKGANVRPNEVCVCPVPTTFWRRMSRGIDHARALSLAAAREIGCDWAALLARAHRPSQRSVPMSARAGNVRGSIRFRRIPGPGVRVIILVDDVITTGSTIRACSRAIREGWVGTGRPVQVWVGSIAVAGADGRNRR